MVPRAQVDVSIQRPECSWSGTGYFDSNFGTEPLQAGFTSWEWSRAHLKEDTLIFYDVERRLLGAADLAIRVDATGTITAIDSPPRRQLPSTFWRMPRAVRWPFGPSSEPGLRLEDTPFYTRTSLRGAFEGETFAMMHESLSLNRLKSPIVRAMLPFRMPRTFR